MTLEEFINKAGFEIINKSDDLSTQLSKVFCCDLLSIAMSKNPPGSVWVTVMGNVNTIAVAVLTDGGCIILAENAVLDEAAMDKAVKQEVTVLRTSMPVFDVALVSYNILNEK